MTVYAAERLLEENGNRTYDTLDHTVTYNVFTNDINTIVTDILNASGLPKIYDKLAGSTNLLAKRFGTKKVSPVTINGITGALWTISVNYELTNPGENGNGTNDTTGLNSRLINFSIDFNTVEKVLEKAYKAGDSFGNPTDPIVNKATQLFDPPVKDAKYNMVLRWTQKEDTSFQYSSVINYIDTINSSGITILGINIPQYLGLMKKINPVYKYDQINNRAYFETTYEVEIDKEGHNTILRNTGFRQLDTNGKLKDILKGDLNDQLEIDNPEEASQRIEDPADLGNNGKLNTTGIPIYLTFNTKYAQNWNALNLMSNIW